MRTLNDYFLKLRNISALQTNGSTSDTVVIPDRGELVEVICKVHVAIDADLTLDIQKNGADTGVDITIPSGTADEAGVVARPGARVEFEVGDSLRLASNGEQTAAGDGDFTAVIRR